MPRRLSEDDRQVWERVTRSTRPLPRALEPKQAPGPVLPAGPAPKPNPLRPPAAATAPPRRNPLLGHDLAMPLDRALTAAPPKMDAGLHRRLKRGKLEPEARIDLHGMTRAQAQPALTGFLMAAHARGVRLALVITGKGRDHGDDDLAVPRRAGALRHDLPHWLAASPLRAIVLDLRPAHRSHGGGGAFYVYLRRRR